MDETGNKNGGGGTDLKTEGRIVQSKKLLLACMGALFLFMLLLNCLTPYVADDYVYRNSFQDGTRLKSLTDVAKSMYVHCFKMNGRVVSHTLEQLFLLVPKAAFNVFNAAVFTGLIYLLYRVANMGRERNVLLLIAIGMAFWFFMPVFGQVVLWQVGALNYLWSLLAGLTLMLPYICRFSRGKELLEKTWQKMLFCAASLLLGMYSEVTSFIAILLSVVLLVLSLAMKKEKPKTWLWVPIAVACVGYTIMMTMPAEAAAKQGELTLEALMRNFSAVTVMLKEHLLTLCLVWGGVFALGCWLKVRREKLILSGVFAFGAVAANYMLIVASYLPERCLCTTAMLLILACGVLAPELVRHRAGVACACGGAVLTVAFLFELVTGSYAIYKNYTDFTAREQQIAQYIAEGQTDLILPCVHASSPYSAFWGTTDLNTEQRETWPNRQMANYYGVDSIIGY